MKDIFNIFKELDKLTIDLSDKALEEAVKDAKELMKESGIRSIEALNLFTKGFVYCSRIYNRIELEKGADPNDVTAMALSIMMVAKTFYEVCLLELTDPSKVH